ncbi:MAG: Ion channel protein [Citrobacter freundii]|nr:MAG: Ion channel protein [Citrobacter freundii]
MNWNWEEFYKKASDWLIVNVPKIIIAIVILFIGFWLIRIFSRWLKKVLEKKQFNPSLRYFLLNLVAITLQIFVIVISLQAAGVKLTFFTAIVAGLSVAAGLALSGTLQNFVSGILILLLRPYRVGDTVVMQGQQGTVDSIQLFYTLVRTFDNKTIIVPNGQLSNNVVINLSREGKRRLDIDLKFPYKTDEEAIRKTVRDIVSQVQGLLPDPPLRVGVTNLEPDKYTISIQVWTKAHGFEDTKMEFQERLMESLKQQQLLA